jgi:tRNA (guanine37-N1)-methyltransferase
MRFDILTIFPDMFHSYMNESILKRAQESGRVSIAIHDIRSFTVDKQHKTDDTPYGGGAGMVMKVEPIFNAMEALKVQNEKFKIQNEGSDCVSDDLLLNIPNFRTILLSAKGKTFRQEDVRRLSKYERIVLICGRYEGVDERVAEHIADEELSIGDFVLTGGELPAMVVVDAVTRLIPCVLGNETSTDTESHRESGYLEYPQYTKPDTFNGWSVPEVLLGGNHAEIESWRLKHSKIPYKKETL